MVELDKIKIMNDNFSKIMDSLGDYIIQVAKVEEANPDFRNFVIKMKEEPAYFSELIQKLPSEVSTTLLSILLKIMNFQSKDSKQRA